MAKKKKTSAEQPKWVKVLAIVLAILFGVAGLYLALNLGEGLVGVRQAKDWVQVDARILSWGLDKTHGTIGVKVAGAVPVKEIRAEYEYSYQGKDYKNTRVGFMKARDNFSDDFRDALIDRLSKASQGSGYDKVWINPAAPDEAVLSRDLPTASALFHMVILIFPCGLATIMLVGYLVGAIGRGLGCKLDNVVVPVWMAVHTLPIIPVVMLSNMQVASVGVWAVTCAMVGMLAAGIIMLIKGLNALKSQKNQKVE